MLQLIESRKADCLEEAGGIRAVVQASRRFFETLGHPARIRVLELLAVRDQLVGELLPEDGFRIVEPVPAVEGRCCGRVSSLPARRAAR